MTEKQNAPADGDDDRAGTPDEQVTSGATGEPATPHRPDETDLAAAGHAPDAPSPAELADSPTFGTPFAGVLPVSPATDDERPLDLREPAPSEPVPPPPSRRPAYYVSLGASGALVAVLVVVAVLVTVLRPGREIPGTAAPWREPVPEITPSGPPTTASPPPSATPPGPFAELTAHPLAGATTRLADTTCALPRFDPADDRQAAFYAAAKSCADTAWAGFLQAHGLPGPVDVVTVTGAIVAGSCGELAPTSQPTECDGTVYVTPAYLRDTEQNGRYPGRYLGVFLREYVRALLHTTGVDALVAALTTGSAEDIDTRAAQQATCLAGVTAGSMAGRGAVDGNITGEIRARLTTMDAPADANVWLDKGFQQRAPAGCNTWG